MSQTVKAIYDIIDSIAPFESAESWDNVGLLIGDESSIVNNILLSLDITEEVVEEAIGEGVNLIITHHPIIFTGVKEITTHTRIGRILLKLMAHQISVIAAHTNLDRSFPFGINRYISDFYGLKGLKPLNEGEGFGIIGHFDEAILFDAFIQKTKKLFDIEVVKVAYPKPNVESEAQFVKNVAISSGASSDFIENAIESGADVFVTGDLKYHESQAVLSTSLTLVDVGHFESEFVFLTRMKSLLDAKLNPSEPSISVQVTRTEKPLFKFL